MKMESIRKLSNFYFQWTKALYQNNNTMYFNQIAFFFTLFEGYKINVIRNNSKEKVLMETREKKIQELQISQNEILRKTTLPVFSQLL